MTTSNFNVPVNQLSRFISLGTIADGTNLNDLTRPASVGYLAMGSTYTNHPASGTPAVVITFDPLYFVGSVEATYMIQLVIITNAIYFRRKFTSAGTGWQAWQMIPLEGCGWQASGTNVDDLVKPGTYGLSASNSYSGTLPSGVQGGVLEVISPAPYDTYVIQRLSTSDAIYTRYRASSSGTAWMGWRKYTSSAA